MWRSLLDQTEMKWIWLEAECKRQMQQKSLHDYDRPEIWHKVKSVWLDWAVNSNNLQGYNGVDEVIRLYYNLIIVHDYGQNVVTSIKNMFKQCVS